MQSPVHAGLFCGDLKSSTAADLRKQRLARLLQVTLFSNQSRLNLSEMAMGVGQFNITIYEETTNVIIAVACMRCDASFPINAVPVAT